MWVSIQRVQVRPKLHYFAHTLDHVLRTRENPRRRDLFTSEDYIGRIKKIGSKCHRSSCSQRVVERLLLSKAYRWHKMRQQTAVKHFAQIQPISSHAILHPPLAEGCGEARSRFRPGRRNPTSGHETECNDFSSKGLHPLQGVQGFSR
jgi:hypothetical protein